MDLELEQRLSVLMKQAQDGDARAYRELLVEVTSLLQRFLRNRLRASSDAAEEVLQETLLSIHRHRHTYDPGRPFGPWMYAIARHRLSDHVLLQRRRESPIPEEAPSPPDGTLRSFLREALSRLSSSQLEVIRMLKLEGFSVAEIAKQTGRSPSNVKVTAHRGYKRLRAWREEPE